MTLTYDPIRVRYYAGGQPLDLTLAETRLLNALRGAGGDVLPDNELYAWLCDDDACAAGSNTISSHVRRVRAKLNAVSPHLGARIVAVRGAGYAWSER